jgi:hypothetical protein
MTYEQIYSRQEFVFPPFGLTLTAVFALFYRCISVLLFEWIVISKRAYDSFMN